MGLNHLHTSNMYCCSFRTLGSPILMQSWKNLCLRLPISSKISRSRIPMPAKTVIISGRQSIIDKLVEYTKFLIHEVVTGKQEVR